MLSQSRRFVYRLERLKNPNTRTKTQTPAAVAAAQGRMVFGEFVSVIMCK